MTKRFRQIPTDELIKKYRNMVENNGGDVPTSAEQRALEIMCYQFGRYLTIAGSREGALPTNLQGVWGEGWFTVVWRLPLQYQCSDELLANTGK
ncbi:MAG: hypothetical protein V8S55_04370 [Mediterraneibacter faecis]